MEINSENIFESSETTSNVSYPQAAPIEAEVSITAPVEEVAEAEGTVPFLTDEDARVIGIVIGNDSGTNSAIITGGVDSIEQALTSDEFVIESENENSEEENSEEEESEIPEYEGTGTNERIKGAPWFDYVNRISIEILGLGGIGSNLAINLARINWREVILRDFDVIESHNLGGQFFNPEYIGLSKVSGARAAMQTINPDLRVLVYQERISSNYLPVLVSSSMGKVIVFGFDNMLARKDAFIGILNFITKIPGDIPILVVDARLLAEQFSILVVNPRVKEDVDWYESTLFEDHEVDEGDCTFRQTGHIALTLGGIITNLITNWITVTSTEFPSRIPKKIDYYGANCLMVTTD